MASLSDESMLQYAPLAEGCIRLLRISPDSTADDIKCSLEHRNHFAMNAEGREPYTALSYCWGTSRSGGSCYLDDLLVQDRDRLKQEYFEHPQVSESLGIGHLSPSTVTVNDCPFPMTDNLRDALSTILAHHDVAQPMWIDAICINQNDADERNAQVTQMGQIFKAAGRVYAYLGREDAWIPLAFKSLRMIHDACCEKERETGSDIIIRVGCLCYREPFEHIQLPYLNSIAVVGLYFRRYFSRVWTQPEYLICDIHTLEIICGRHRIDGVTFTHGLRTAVIPHEPMPGRLSQLLFQRNTTRAAEIQDTCFPHSSPPYKFRCVFEMLAVCECTDPRDRIFAMLGDPGLQQVCKPGNQLGPDYRWTIDELVLVVLSFYDQLLLHPDYQPDLLKKITWPLDQSRVFRELDRLFKNLAPALGCPRMLEDFRTWFDSHEEWVTCIHQTGSVTLGTGRVVDCSGPTLDLILQQRDYVGSVKGTGPDQITIRVDFERGHRITHVVD